VALVRPDGRVIIGAESTVPTVQALVRWDPAGHAARELAERAELGFPPAVRMASVSGARAGVAELFEIADLPHPHEVLGPVPAGEGRQRALVRVSRAQGNALAASLKAAAAIRSARKAADPVRVVLDPLELF
jgi:primosomal protein N' (replication factor Y)